MPRPLALPPASYPSRPGNRKITDEQKGNDRQQTDKRRQETTGSAGPCSFLVVNVVLAREGKDR